MCQALGSILRTTKQVIKMPVSAKETSSSFYYAIQRINNQDLSKSLSLKLMDSASMDGQWVSWIHLSLYSNSSIPVRLGHRHAHTWGENQKTDCSHCHLKAGPQKTREKKMRPRQKASDMNKGSGLQISERQAVCWPRTVTCLLIRKRAAVRMDLWFWRRGTRKARTEADDDSSSSSIPEVGVSLPGLLPPGFHPGWKAPGAAYRHQRAPGISPQLPFIAKKASPRATLGDSGCEKAQGSATCSHHTTKCPTLALAATQLASVVQSCGIHLFDHKRRTGTLKTNWNHSCPS